MCLWLDFRRPTFPHQHYYTSNALHRGHPRHPQSAQYLCTVTVTLHPFTSELSVFVGAGSGGVVSVDPAAHCRRVQEFVGHALLSGDTQICGHATPCHLVVVAQDAQATVSDGHSEVAGVTRAVADVVGATIVDWEMRPEMRTMSAVVMCIFEMDLGSPYIASLPGLGTYLLDKSRVFIHLTIL